MLQLKSADQIVHCISVTHVLNKGVGPAYQSQGHCEPNPVQVKLDVLGTLRTNHLARVANSTVDNWNGGDDYRVNGETRRNPENYCVDVYRIRVPKPMCTPKSLKLFRLYAQDAGNWGGTPMVGGNVGGNAAAQRGNLTNLKKAGLIQTWTDEGDGCSFLSFTEYGRNVAAMLFQIYL